MVMGKTYVIGNINGKYQELITLLEKMNLGIKDKLYILGDTIGYRKGSLKALQFFMKMPNCGCIMGTQEFIMLQNRKTLEKLNRESKDNSYNIKTGTDYMDFTVLNQIKPCNPCNPCPKNR